MGGLQPRPQGLLLDDFQNGGSTGEDPVKGWYHVVQNLQKSWRFLSRDILRKAKTKWRRSIACEAKHRSKNALTLYTRQWWLRSKVKYYFNGCFDSGAGPFSICKFIPLSHSLYNFVITVTEIRLNIKENKYRVKKRTLCVLI